MFKLTMVVVYNDVWEANGTLTLFNDNETKEVNFVSYSASKQEVINDIMRLVSYHVMAKKE